MCDVAWCKAAHAAHGRDGTHNLFDIKESREIGISLPKSQRQHCTLHIQKDVLPYA